MNSRFKLLLILILISANSFSQKDGDGFKDIFGSNELPQVIFDSLFFTTIKTDKHLYGFWISKEKTKSIFDEGSNYLKFYFSPNNSFYTFKKTTDSLAHVRFFLARKGRLTMFEKENESIVKQHEIVNYKIRFRRLILVFEDEEKIVFKRFRS
ncbi:MAG: hypothetical protein AB8B53_15050 [Flavobacteriales bacterium]